MKYYVVINGRKQGIYTSWAEAKVQVDNYSNPVYKSFTAFSDAIDWASAALEAGGYPYKANHGKHLGPTGKAQVREERRLSKAPEDSIIVYTDGGCRNTGNHIGQHTKSYDKAAWAYLIVLPNGERVSNSQGMYGKTNNVAELTAFAKACEKLVELGLSDRPVKFVLDSRYVLNPLETRNIVKWAHNEWREERANKEYWIQIWKNFSRLTDVYYHWVKGHDVTQGNITVDQMANETMDKMESRYNNV